MRGLRHHWVSSGSALILAAGVLISFAVPAGATVITLADRNSTAVIDTGSSAGMYSWVVDDVEHIFQQWFWYRIGDTGEEFPVNSLTLYDENVIDTNGIVDPHDDNLSIRYGTKDTLWLDIEYSLSGGAPGSHASDIMETITIQNNSGTTLDFHFFQYTDFNLNENANNDVVVMEDRYRVSQSGGLWVASETVVSPEADYIEANYYNATNATLIKLNDGFATVLNDVPTAGPGNVTWAFQWDLTVASGDTEIITKDKRLYLIPEPLTMLAVFGGLLGLGGYIRRRNVPLGRKLA